MYYNIDDGETNSLTDLGSNGLNGTVLNAVAAPVVLDTDYRFNHGSPVTLTGTDTAGNSAVAIAFVKVEDNIAPVITLNGNLSETLNLGAVYTELGATATDNCSIDVNGVVVAGDVVDTAITGTYSVTYNAMDTSGNPATQVTRTVIVNDPPSLTTVSLTSNNVNQSFSPTGVFAKAGDVITLNFTASEDLLATPVVSIANQTATVTQGATASDWTATYTIPTIASLNQASLPDGAITFSIDYENLDNVTGATVTSTTDSSSVTLDRTIPTVGAVTIASTNAANNSIGLVGNNVNISLTNGAEPLYRGVFLNPSTISGIDVNTLGNISNGNLIGFTIPSLASVDLATLPDGAATLDIILYDEAGNEVNVTATTDNSEVLINRAVPVLTSVSMSSDNGLDSAFAKAGNTISIDFAASEELKASPVVTIAGQTAVVTQGTDATLWTATYLVPNIATLDQTVLPDGLLGFTINFEDLGTFQGTEVTVTTDATTVTLDRTAPIITASDYTASLDANGSVTIVASDMNVQASDGVCQEVLPYGSSLTLRETVTGDFINVNNNSSNYISFNTAGLDFILNAGSSTTGSFLKQGDEVELRATVSSISYPLQPSSPTGLNNFGIGLVSIYQPNLNNGDPIDPNLPVYISSNFGSYLSFSTSNNVFVFDQFANALTFDLITNDIISETDGCLDNNQVTLSTSTLDCSDIGVQPVTITATDNAGNETQIIQNVTIADDTAPVIDLGGNVIINVSLGDTYTDVTPTVTDNCTTMTLNTNFFANGVASVNTNQIGSYDITYTATDDSGNTSSTARTVNVGDFIVPTLSNVTIVSNNSISNEIAGIGNTVTVTFLPSEAVTNVTATFGSSSMVVSSPATSGAPWTAAYTVQENDSENGLTGFEINFEDLNGNAGTAVVASTTGTSTIDVDAIAPYLIVSTFGK